MSEFKLVSVVVPVYNEEKNLPELARRLAAVGPQLGADYELIFVDDGSSDGSLELLKGLAAADARVRVVEFNRNYGQHRAVFAGMAESRGEAIVTLDADLQNPPEEIPRLLERLAAGCDIVGGCRVTRRDSLLRKLISFINNRVASLATGVRLRDYGCMLRAYRREVVDQMVRCPEYPRYVPAMGHLFAKRVEEVEVRHDQRHAGRSRYRLTGLVHLWLDLMTGFSVLPLTLVSLLGLIIALTGLGFGSFLMVRRLVVGPEAEGIFTLFAILFFFVGAQIFCVGVVGEYLGRMFTEVRRRPNYVVRAVHGRRPDSPEAPK